MPIIYMIYHDFIEPILGIGFFATLVGVFWKYFSERQIERVRRDFKKEISSLNFKLDQQKESFVHVFKAKFDLEIKVYQEIWLSMFELRSATLSMQPRVDSLPMFEGEDAKRDRMIKRHQKFVDAYNNALVIYVKYQPFYPEDIHDNVNAFMKSCNNEGTRYENVIRTNDTQVLLKEHFDYIDSLEVSFEKSCKLIRDRLEKVSVV